jgi:hypothetical protein
MQLHLRQTTWTLGERIDGGGFGQVYAAKSADYESAVAKLVPKEPGAERELLFVPRCSPDRPRCGCCPVWVAVL